MADTAVEILSLAAAKAQLDIVETDSTHDANILMAISNAVNYAVEMTGIPLLKRSEQEDIFPRGKDAPAKVQTRDVQSVDKILYWTPTQTAREEPAGEIEDLTTLGEIRPTDTRMGWRTEIWPPQDGWPERSAYMPHLRITYTLNWDIPDKGHSVLQAIILLTRLFFEQPERLETDFAIHALLSPHRRWNG